MGKYVVLLYQKLRKGDLKMKTDHYYKGIHYVKYQGLLDNQPVVKLTAFNFKLMRDYIEDLEMQIYRLTGKHFSSLKEKE